MVRPAGGLEVEVRTSGIWQLSSIVLSAGKSSVVIDPGYFPRELEELAALARSRGEVVAVVFTHGHWDHVMGWRMFPGVPVLGSPSLARAVHENATVAKKNLADADEFDRRWYVKRPGPAVWPKEIVGLADSSFVELKDFAVSTYLLPGHSEDGLALLAAERGVLIAGDYLSPCEIPFVEDLSAYRSTLARLLELIEMVDEIIPGHGPRLSRSEAKEIAIQDLRYLEALAECGERRDLTRALAVQLPRAASVPGMHEHHRENCEKALFS